MLEKLVCVFVFLICAFMECPCYPTFGNNLAADLALVNCENGNSFDLRNIGHGGMCGKESRVHNDFGLDYKNLKDAGYAADEIWPILCEMDSDNDNRTNGEELGDPNCAWRKCETGTCTKTTAVSHPGYEEVYDNTTLKIIQTIILFAKILIIACFKWQYFLNIRSLYKKGYFIARDFIVCLKLYSQLSEIQVYIKLWKRMSRVMHLFNMISMKYIIMHNAPLHIFKM